MMLLFKSEVKMIWLTVFPLLFICAKVECLDIECEEALGMENGAIHDGQITASSEWDPNHAPKQGRLNFKGTRGKSGSWSAKRNDVNQWLQVDLGDHLTKITTVATQGRNDYSQWVTKYKLQYSNDGVNFQYYNCKEQGQNLDKEFPGNADRDTIVYQQLNPPIRARYIRFRPTAWNGHISMRVELYGCIACHEALGMENGAIHDQQITASSEWNSNHAPKQGRLNFKGTHGKSGSWSAKSNDVNQWLQIDLGDQLTEITTVATQGRNDYNQWVTKYKLQYSNDGVNFQYYRKQGQYIDKEFPGNADRNTIVYHELNPPIRASDVRFRPTAWHGHISIRVELYGCNVVPPPLAMYPLNQKYTTEDLERRPAIKGTASNTVFTSGPHNEPNGAYQFSGNANSYIEFPNGGGLLDAKNSITLMCWVRPGGKDGPLFNYAKNAWGVHIWIVVGKFFVRITKYNSHGFYDALMTDQPLEKENWVHVAATYNFNTGVNSIYVDGVLKKTKKIGAGTRISTNDPQVRMGSREGDGRHFNGAIAQMGVWNGALTPAQILAVRNKDKTRACQEALGMENGAIHDGQITASSEWDPNHAPKQGRLNFKGTRGKSGSWSAKKNDVNQWLQVDLGDQLTEITHVATQGRNDYNQWVTKYKLQYSNDGVNFQNYRELTDKEFSGNAGRDTIVHQQLNPPIRARYVRFRPTAWYGHISMRVELYGCKCKDNRFTI